MDATMLKGCLADRVTPASDEGYISQKESLSLNTNISQKLRDKDPQIDDFNFHQKSFICRLFRR